MMKKLMIVLAALATVWTAGCENAAKENPWELNECTEHCEEENTELPELDGTYISGHLGNYESCPEDGYSGDGGAGDHEPAQGDVAGGACAADGDCPTLVACEDGQITVRLTNTGEASARELQVTTIELFDAEGVSRAILPLIDAVDTSTYETFDGTLAVDEEVTLRVEFQGPANPYSLLQPESDPDGGRSPGSTHGTLEVTVSAKNHDDIVIESSELYPVPSVDT